MQLSVIILNYNVRYFLELCVSSVQKSIVNLDAEIIVIDNNSSDDSCKMMQARFPNIKLIANKKNSGFPKGNNIAVTEAQGEYICILHPDTVVAEDTFEKVLHFAKSKSNLGAVGCKLIDGAGGFLPESKRGIPTPWVAFTKVTGLYKVFPKWSLFNKYYAQHLNQNQTGATDILVGAFMVLKKTDYLALNGFDEDCFMYSDDIDLSYRLLQLNKQNYYFADTTVVHFKGESTIRDAKYRQRFQEAMEYFYNKHFKPSFLFSMFMKLGSFVFAVIKKHQAVTIQKKADVSVLISTNEVLYASILKSKNEKLKRLSKIEDFNVFSQKQNKSEIIEIILDTNTLKYKDCLAFMEQYSGKNMLFKLLPKESNFHLGSNNSNDRGTVVTNLY